MPTGGEYGAVLETQFREDLRLWVETDRRVALRIFDLVEAIVRQPFAGMANRNPSNISWRAVGQGVLRRSIASCIGFRGSTCTSYKRGITTEHHSYRNASIGSNLAALIAGNIPLTIPTKPKITVDQTRIAESIFR